jgi:hypothetical protein
MKNRVENPDLLRIYRTMPCLCSPSGDCKGEVAAHHMITRARKGPDEHWNLMPLCFYHHLIQLPSLGFTTFVEIHDLSEYMIKKGWEFNDYTQRWINQEWNEREIDGKKIYRARAL